MKRTGPGSKPKLAERGIPICGAGIGFAVLLLYLFHTWLGCNLYLSDLVAIGLVALWKFGLGARFDWRTREEVA